MTDRLWMWFDRATRYNVYAKIIVLMFVVSVLLFMVGIGIKAYESIYGGSAMMLLAAVIFGAGMFVLNMLLPSTGTSDVVDDWMAAVYLPEKHRHNNDNT